MRSLILLGALCVAPAHASFMVSQSSAIVNTQEGIVSFDLIFNQVPDFYTADQFGRYANAFQIMVIADPKRPSPEMYDSIVRGGEIAVANTIPIRAAFPKRPDGSWGETRVEVPFVLSATRITFSAPLAAVSPSHLDGHFGYELLSEEYGASTQDVRLDAYVQGDIPEPALMWIVGAALMVLVRRASMLNNRTAGMYQFDNLR